MGDQWYVAEKNSTKPKPTDDQNTRTHTQTAFPAGVARIPSHHQGFLHGNKKKAPNPNLKMIRIQNIEDFLQNYYYYFVGSEGTQ